MVYSSRSSDYGPVHVTKELPFHSLHGKFFCPKKLSRPGRPAFQWVSVAHCSSEDKAGGAWCCPLRSNDDIKNTWSGTSTTQNAW